jgi:hypothetical protein
LKPEQCVLSVPAASVNLSEKTGNGAVAGTTGKSHQLPTISNSNDRLLCEVYWPFGGVFDQTADASGGSCNKQPSLICLETGAKRPISDIPSEPSL